MNYIEIKKESPPEGEFVMTAIIDSQGIRNEQFMKKVGNLWFTRDNMYVYYSPTHWKRKW